MEVILKEEVAKLGSIGDIVKVKAGFARNYLLPRGMAVLADRRNTSAMEHQKRIAGEKRERDLRASKNLAGNIESLTVTIAARAGEEGKLFGSVTNQDIERALQEKGFSIERRRIRLDEPIKSLGQHTVVVHLPLSVEAKITVSVVPEE